MSGAPSDSYAGGLFRTASAGNMSRSIKRRQQLGNAKPPSGNKPRERKRRATPRLDQFAEHLANGLAPGDAAAAMGLSRKKGHDLLGKLRKRLGPQAV